MKRFLYLVSLGIKWNGVIILSHAFEEQQEKEERMKAAMKRKGYSECENCGEMFIPDVKGDFVCQNCMEHALRE